MIDACRKSRDPAVQRRIVSVGKPLPSVEVEIRDERGRKLTRAALAQKLGLPPVRVQTLVAAMRRLLNVDGYDVLSVDEASDTMELNLELLKTQFELDV